MEAKPLLHFFGVPAVADSMVPPVVTYGGLSGNRRPWTKEELAFIENRPPQEAAALKDLAQRNQTLINFLTTDRRLGRVTFEKLNAIRACSGEGLPYGVATRGTDYSCNPGGHWWYNWVATVSNSPWLQERYDYLKRYYAQAGVDVEERNAELSHFLFRFAEDYVEVLSAGIWFDSVGLLPGGLLDAPVGFLEADSDHPLGNLPESSITERIEAHGVACQVRQNPLAIEALKTRAKYCSQKVLQGVIERAGGVSSLRWTLSLRMRDGVLKTSLVDSTGVNSRQYDSIPSLADIRPQIAVWLAEIQERQTKSGKA